MRATPAVLLLSALVALPAHAADPDILSLPAAFFAAAQPVTALDIVQRIPGFAFDKGDGDVRGFAGAAGNVLVDGRRPASKQDGLEEVLRRIPAASVDHVELIRGGAKGIDMAGQPVLANIVRRREAATRGQMETGAGLYPDGRATPSARIDGSRRWGDRLLEGALSLYRTIDDTKGAGPRYRFAPDGTLLRDTIYAEDDGFTGGEASAAYEHPLAGGRLRANLSLKRERERAATRQLTTRPRPVDERDLELEIDTDGEAGLNWDGGIGKAMTLELVAIQRLSRVAASQTADTGGSLEAADQRSHGGESVGRARLRWQATTALTLEGGGEAAYTVLDSRSRLFDDGVAVPLPAAAVRVAETRGEGFATATWHPGPHWTLEGGARVELSRLVQSGDSRLTKSFVYPKPRLLVTWAPSPRSQLRLGLERTVGQLDFADFVSSASLTSNTITAGNADIEPDRRTTLSATWERRFAGQAALVLTARHVWIADAVDRIPVIGPGYAFDAPGNIGAGRLGRIEGDLTLPLDAVGIAGGLLKASGGVEQSRVTDPTTGRRRGISGETPFDGELHFTQDRPAIGFRWGADVAWRHQKNQYRFNEVRRETTATKIDLFAEYRLAAAWNLRVFADNVTSRHIRRVRAISAGARDASNLAYVEDRDLAVRPQLGFLLRHQIGRDVT